jgi:hypothetical protein
MADKTNGSQPQKAPGDISKKEAVRRALQHLGNEAKPMQIREHIQKRYHIEMGLDHISTTKSEILRESGQAKSAAQQPATPKVAIRKEASAKAATPQGDGVPGIRLTDIETVKDLVERVGATSLKKLIDVMAR